MTMRKIEKILAILAVVLALATDAWIYLNLLNLAPYSTEHQSLWPFPALYFVEIALFSIIVCLLVFTDSKPGVKFIWAITGGVFGFILLGAMSVGLFYIPLLLLFGIIAILLTIKRKSNPLVDTIFGVSGALAQMALILAMVQLSYL